ncbi:MAG: hypothetical protein HY537_08525 [Deltaproteobacteria bacterium]|nr:hypothetical protein [Deltaproteobacteria bacterium]
MKRNFICVLSCLCGFSSFAYEPNQMIERSSVWETPTERAASFVRKHLDGAQKRQVELQERKKTDVIEPESTEPPVNNPDLPSATALANQMNLEFFGGNGDMGWLNEIAASIRIGGRPAGRAYAELMKTLQSNRGALFKKLEDNKTVFCPFDRWVFLMAFDAYDQAEGGIDRDQLDFQAVSGAREQSVAKLDGKRISDAFYESIAPIAFPLRKELADKISKAANEKYGEIKFNSDRFLSEYEILPKSYGTIHVRQPSRFSFSIKEQSSDFRKLIEKWMQKTDKKKTSR